ncbi:MAG: hypothetical protein ACRCT8_15055 [Lacipirellulaceae bacterium]
MTTQYTITSAHRITGKSRTTIQKHLKRGVLSCTLGPDGVKLIDASELLRVYGDACDFARAEEGASTSQPLADESATLRTRLDATQELLDTLREERRRERDQLTAQVEHLRDSLKLAQEGHNRATLLLESRAGTAAPPAVPESAGPADWRDRAWWRLVWP